MTSEAKRCPSSISSHEEEEARKAVEHFGKRGKENTTQNREVSTIERLLVDKTEVTQASAKHTCVSLSDRENKPPAAVDVLQHRLCKTVKTSKATLD